MAALTAGVDLICHIRAANLAGIKGYSTVPRGYGLNSVLGAFSGFKGRELSCAE